MSDADLLARAHEWLAHDPDPETRAELRGLIDAGDVAELAERFAGPLVFGTAGLRGLIGAGETRMNRAVVLRATYGLGATLLAEDAGHAARGVVVGYDGRRKSRAFAEAAAEVLAALGIVVHLTERTCPTPLVAFGVTDLGAAAGVMITASHNPPDYNGYKAYWANGAQIVPPIDQRIAAAIAAAPTADAVPLLPLAEAERDGLLTRQGDALEERYLAAIAALARGRGGDRDLPLVYTPLHGVGLPLLREALRRAGFTALHVVAAQAEPDGRFPTVAFPNPEEPGALDLALELAREREAALIIANDPDADRLAVVVRAPDGEYVPLTGNEVGALLGHYLLTEGEGAAGDRLVMTTIVSSPLLGAMASALGARYRETLTGFKWIANGALELERAHGTRFVFGYEEALGYSVGPVVRDKDGISAALHLAELAALRRAEGKTLLDELEGIARRYGLYLSGQRSKTYPGSAGLETMRALMARLRAEPPREVAGLAVLALRDVLVGERVTAEGAREPLDLPRSDVLVFELAGGQRVIARPSGTEPKLKLYVDVREEVAPGEPFAAARARARERLAALADAFATLVA